MGGDVAITIQQLSPVIAHTYEESSLPCAVFLVDVNNKCSDPIDVTVLFTFQVAENRCIPKHGAENVGCTVGLDVHVQVCVCVFPLALY